MSDICPVCEKEIGFWRIDLGGVLVHSGCEATYLKDPEIFGGGAKTETLTKNEKEAVEQRKQRINKTILTNPNPSLKHFFLCEIKS